MENYKMQHLLDSVSIISKKYEDIAKITGENFNIFTVLSMERREVKTHSAFLGELLNPKGNHGLGDEFLKIFIQQMKDKFEDRFDSEFDTLSASAFVEQYLGRINEDKTVGGRIDIVIKDSKNKSIVIENKIDAYEQENQLIRYNNAYPNAPIFFLTLTGYESVTANESFKYFQISYKEDIVKWLEQCLKEATDHPMLREVIKQYIYLIKKLTNQTTNNTMSEEIVNTMRKSVKESFEIQNNIWKLQEELYLKFMDLVEKFANNNEISVDNTDLSVPAYYGLNLTPKSWNNKQYKICVLFVEHNYINLYFGISDLDKLSDDERFKISENFKIKGYDVNDYSISKCPTHNDWNNDPEIWEDISKGIDGKTYKEITEGILRIIEIEKGINF